MAKGSTAAPGGDVPGPASGSPESSSASDAGISHEGWVTLGKEIEPWLVLALEALASSGRVDLDLPVAMHLPLLASPRSDAITPRQLIDHNAHLGARAYEDFLRANPGSDALKAQAFLVALSSDDTPGERSNWRRAHLDLMGWLIVAVAGEQSLAAALASVLGDEVRAGDGEVAPIIPIRAELSVLASRHAEVLKGWEARR